MLQNWTGSLYGRAPSLGICSRNNRNLKKSQKLETNKEAEVSPEVDFDVEKPEAKIPNFMEKNVQIENKKRKKLLSRKRRDEIPFCAYLCVSIFMDNRKTETYEKVFCFLKKLITDVTRRVLKVEYIGKLKIKSLFYRSRLV